MFPIVTTTCSRIPTITFFHIYDVFYTHINIYHYSFELYFLPSNLHLDLHDICFAKIFVSLFLQSYQQNPYLNLHFFFGTRTLLDKSLRVLQLPTHLS